MWLTELKITHLGGKWVELLEPLVYLDRDTVYIVPAGFVCDGASVPRFPIVYWLTGNTAHRAAVLHDMLYRCHLVGRREADQIFHRAMNEPYWRKEMMYRAVRMCGSFAYRHNPVFDPRKPHSDKNVIADWRSFMVPYNDYIKQEVRNAEARGSFGFNGDDGFLVGGMLGVGSHQPG